MSSADAGARRRERGVIAQREYRKRHASKVQKLQDENQRLKDVIAEIDRASRRRGALPDDLSAALSKGRDLAGISDDPPARDSASDEDADQMSCSSSEQPLQVSPPPSITRVPLDLEPSPEDQTHPGGRLSPRLDYGLWLEADPLIRVADPPIDIVPYLGAGMHTLAGCIFWSCINYTIDLWNSRSAVPAVKHLDRMFGHSEYLTDRPYLISLVQARMDYKQKGYMFRKLSEQFERNATTDLHQRIKHDYESKGLPSKYWKKPEEVAENLLNQLTTEQAERFQAVVKGKGTPEDGEMVRSIVTWLAQNFVCFGDGPRWSTVFVSIGLGTWIQELKAIESRAQNKSSRSTEAPS